MKVKRDSIQGWLFLAPALILLVAYLVYPCLSTLKMISMVAKVFPQALCGLCKLRAASGGGDSLFLNLSGRPQER